MESRRLTEREQEEKRLQRFPRLHRELGVCAVLFFFFFASVCVSLCARVCVCWPHVPQQDAHGNERLDTSKHLRPTDLIPPSDQHSRCQPPTAMRSGAVGDCGVTQLF